MDLQLPLGRRKELRDRLLVFGTSPLVRHRLAIDQVLYSWRGRGSRVPPTGPRAARPARPHHRPDRRAGASEHESPAGGGPLPNDRRLLGVRRLAAGQGVTGVPPVAGDDVRLPGLGKVVEVKSAGRIRVAMPTAQPCWDEVDADPGEATVVSMSRRHGRRRPLTGGAQGCNSSPVYGSAASTTSARLKTAPECWSTGCG